MHVIYLGLGTILSIFLVSVVTEYFLGRSVLGSMIRSGVAMTILVFAYRLGWIKFDFVTIAAITLMYYVGGVVGEALPKKKGHKVPMI